MNIVEADDTYRARIISNPTVDRSHPMLNAAGDELDAFGEWVGVRRRKLRIENSFEIGDLPNGNATLTLHMRVNGESTHSFTTFSGPRSDLEDYLEGRATSEEINERWSSRRRRVAR